MAVHKHEVILRWLCKLG